MYSTPNRCERGRKGGGFVSGPILLPIYDDGSFAKKGRATMSRWVKTLGLLAVLATILAACGSAAPSGGTAATAAPAAGGTAATAAPAAGGQTAGGGKLEMFSWWTTGGEEAGLKAMYELYKKDNPGVEIVNQAVAGAA